MTELKVLELFSGIGGMHQGFIESRARGKIVGAVDINPVANSVYALNFPDVPILQRNLDAFTPKDIQKLGANMLLMSPPCQPFTKRGKKRGLDDTRSTPLIKFIKMVPDLSTINYILMENVEDFILSSAWTEVVAVLKENAFEVQEFVLSPDTFFIPNSRPRYYLLAKRKPRSFQYPFKDELSCSSVPYALPVDVRVSTSSMKPKCAWLCDLNAQYRYLSNGDQCFSLNNILENLKPGEDDDHLLSDEFLTNFTWGMDIVDKDSKTSNCFTKSYRRYHLGSGSVVFPFHDYNERHKVFSNLSNFSNRNAKLTPEDLATLKAMRPRYFTPTEIQRLMCFPDTFKFPTQLTHRQCSALLGNSVNVHIIALLVAYLLVGDEI